MPDLPLTPPQMMILAILAATMAAFIWGRYRHDIVALAALMACVLTGLVPAAEAFAGFGHPAVITVACVLVLSHGLQNSGAVDALSRTVLPAGGGRIGALTALVALGATLSAFMNNVGALALLMPVSVQLANRLDIPPGQVLMPLSFGTILGGMTTLIGTPPNLIVSGFRAQTDAGAFGMFDFLPVGGAVALAGVVFVVVIGWRLVPRRRPASGDTFETGTYMTEVRVPERSKAAGMTLRAFERELGEDGTQVLAMVRNDVRITVPHGGRRIRANDILVLETGVDGLADALAAFNMALEEQGSSSEKDEEEKDQEKAATARATPPARAATAPGPKASSGKAGARDDDQPENAKGDTEDDTRDDAEKDTRRDKTKHEEDIVLRELVVMPASPIAGQSATDLRLRTRYGLNLLAISRSGHPSRARLRTLKLRAGDLLLMQGPAEVMSDFMQETGCVPLGQRNLRLPDRRRALTAAAIMLGAVGAVTVGLLPAAAAFALAVLVSVLLNTVPARQLYHAIDWPVVVLLAALIPVAGAMQATGTASILARLMLDGIAQGHAIAALAVVLVLTMVLSDVMNNAATAAVMCPVALGVAAALGTNADSFLMAVAIGASCAFLTPIGHQNNTLILGPGGFGFGDYWRLGLPLQVLIVAVSLPLLLVFWPL
ncbi:MAG: SLC13 family permease [Pararhodobacter sp.]|nr:SLC13 family permease [Pararhodobacter sp.]